MSLYLWTYWLFLLGLAILGFWFLPLLLKRRKELVVKRLQQQNQFQSVSSSPPITNPNEKAKELAVENVGEQFSIIRISILTFFLSLLIFLSVVPFLQQIPLTILSVLISAFGIVIGIAMRPIIENFISGIQLTFSKKIRIGDTVVVHDQYGTIEDISTFHTVIKIWDWKRLILSNSTMMSEDIINYSVSDKYIWTHIEFWVAYDSNLEEVKSLSTKIALKHTSLEVEQTPKFWVMEMGVNSIKCWVATWAQSPAEAWTVAANIRTDLSFALQEKGIRPHEHIMNIKKSGERKEPVKPILNG